MAFKRSEVAEEASSVESVEWVGHSMRESTPIIHSRRMVPRMVPLVRRCEQAWGRLSRLNSEDLAQQHQHSHQHSSSRAAITQLQPMGVVVLDKEFINAYYWPAVDRALEERLPALVRARTVEGRPHCFPVTLNHGQPGTLVPC